MGINFWPCPLSFIFAFKDLKRNSSKEKKPHLSFETPNFAELPLNVMHRTRTVRLCLSAWAASGVIRRRVAYNSSTRQIGFVNIFILIDWNFPTLSKWALEGNRIHISGITKFWFQKSDVKKSLFSSADSRRHTSLYQALPSLSNRKSDFRTMDAKMIFAFRSFNEIELFFVPLEFWRFSRVRRKQTVCKMRQAMNPRWLAL